jgi:putative transcriptional regulator
MPLRNNLQELLKKREMNLYQLHQLTGIGYHVLDAHLKNRARQIGHKTIEKICEVLNCSVEDLLTLDEDNESREACKELVEESTPTS